jgi:hypothetical protein
MSSDLRTLITSQSGCPGMLQVGVGLRLVRRVPRDTLDAGPDSSEGTRRPKDRAAIEADDSRDASEAGTDSSEGACRPGPCIVAEFPRDGLETETDSSKATR